MPMWRLRERNKGLVGGSCRRHTIRSMENMKALIFFFSLAPAIIPSGLPADTVQSPAPGSPAVNIAVMDFKPNNAPAGEAVAVSGFVRSTFVKAGVYNVVDKENMERIMSEQAFQQTGCTSDACAVKLGKLLNVQKMVVGEYTVMGGVRFLTASLVDVETGKIEGTGKVKGFEPGNADEAAEKLVVELMGAAGNHPADKEALAQAQADEVRARAEAEKARLKAEAETARKAERERLEAERKAAEALLPVDPRVALGKYGVGLNWPGLGLRALVGARWMVEARGQYEKEAQAYGGRLYRYVFPSGRIYPYFGAGGAWVCYQGNDLNANGYAGEAFVGLEYFIWKKLSLQADCGAAYVGLGQGGVSVSGVRFIVNLGLTYYFGGKPQ